MCDAFTEQGVSLTPAREALQHALISLLLEKSLAWIREQSLDPLCVESMANHDPDIEPHVVEV